MEEITPEGAAIFLLVFIVVLLLVFCWTKI